jgi:uncharacterized protein (DUF58 family)
MFTAMATGFSLFYRLIYILALTIVFAFGWNWLNIRGLSVTIDRRSKRVRVGDNVEERITVQNLSRIAKPILEVEDLSDLPGYSNGMAVSLPSKKFRSWLSSAPARKRGVYTMGPVKVSNTDLFGLFKRDRLFGDSETLLVYPRTHDIPGFAIPPAHLSGESSARRRSHDLTPHAASVRDYASGDSISRVHWNSSARMGKLMSKEFDLGFSSDVWIVVDLHRDVQAGELEESTDEYAVSIAASLAHKYLGAQLPAGLMAYGDQRYMLQAETGSGQFERIMEFLAMSKAEGEVSLDGVFALEERLWGKHSSVVVITPSHRMEWVTALKELTRRRVRVAVILLDGKSFGGIFDSTSVVPELYYAGIPPYVVRQGDAIPVALSQTYTMSNVAPEAAS